MTASIVLLPGDGIGPEVTAAAGRVLEAAASLHDHPVALSEHPIGGAAIDAHGDPLPAATEHACRAADAVFLGAVGGPKWAAQPPANRPEQGLLRLRAALGVFANLRPVRVNPMLVDASPLRPDRLAGVDILVVRELTGGLYFGDKEEGSEHAFDACRYSREEVARIVRVAGHAARERRGSLVSVDKANVLATSRLWRATTDAVCAEEFSDVSLEHLLVDAAAMHLLSQPARFDVIVTENLFGDILTDEASMLAGSMGLLPSASLAGIDGRGLYEPIHGSAPDIAGLGIANPVGAILSMAMLLRYSLGAPAPAAAIEAAVDQVLAEGLRTRDVAATGTHEVGTDAFADAVVTALDTTRPQAAGRGTAGA